MAVNPDEALLFNICGTSDASGDNGVCGGMGRPTGSGVKKMEVCINGVKQVIYVPDVVPDASEQSLFSVPPINVTGDTVSLPGSGVTSDGGSALIGRNVSNTQETNNTSNSVMCSGASVVQLSNDAMLASTITASFSQHAVATAVASLLLGGGSQSSGCDDVINRLIQHSNVVSSLGTSICSTVASVTHSSLMTSCSTILPSTASQPVTTTTASNSSHNSSKSGRVRSAAHNTVVDLLDEPDSPPSTVSVPLTFTNLISQVVSHAITLPTSSSVPVWPSTYNQFHSSIANQADTTINKSSTIPLSTNAASVANNHQPSGYVDLKRFVTDTSYASTVSKNIAAPPQYPYVRHIGASTVSKNVTPQQYPYVRHINTSTVVPPEPNPPYRKPNSTVYTYNNYTYKALRDAQNGLNINHRYAASLNANRYTTNNSSIVPPNVNMGTYNQRFDNTYTQGYSSGWNMASNLYGTYQNSSAVPTVNMQEPMYNLGPSMYTSNVPSNPLPLANSFGSLPVDINTSVAERLSGLIPYTFSSNMYNSSYNTSNSFNILSPGNNVLVNSAILTTENRTTSNPPACIVRPMGQNLTTTNTLPVSRQNTATTNTLPVPVSQKNQTQQDKQTTNSMYSILAAMQPIAPAVQDEQLEARTAADYQNLLNAALSLSDKTSSVSLLHKACATVTPTLRCISNVNSNKSGTCDTFQSYQEYRSDLETKKQSKGTKERGIDKRARKQALNATLDDNNEQAVSILQNQNGADRLSNVDQNSSDSSQFPSDLIDQELCENSIGKIIEAGISGSKLRLSCDEKVKQKEDSASIPHGQKKSNNRVKGASVSGKSSSSKIGASDNVGKEHSIQAVNERSEANKSPSSISNLSMDIFNDLSQMSEGSEYSRKSASGSVVEKKNSDASEKEFTKMPDFSQSTGDFTHAKVKYVAIGKSPRNFSRQASKTSATKSLRRKKRRNDDESSNDSWKPDRLEEEEDDNSSFCDDDNDRLDNDDDFLCDDSDSSRQSLDESSWSSDDSVTISRRHYRRRKRGRTREKSRVGRRGMRLRELAERRRLRNDREQFRRKVLNRNSSYRFRSDKDSVDPSCYVSLEVLNLHKSKTCDVSKLEDIVCCKLVICCKLVNRQDSERKPSNLGKWERCVRSRFTSSSEENTEECEKKSFQVKTSKRDSSETEVEEETCVPTKRKKFKRLVLSSDESDSL